MSVDETGRYEVSCCHTFGLDVVGGQQVGVYAPVRGRLLSHAVEWETRPPDGYRHAMYILLTAAMAVDRVCKTERGDSQSGWAGHRGAMCSAQKARTAAVTRACVAGSFQNA